MVYLSLLLVLTIFLGGGFSYEANKALPGSMLYFYKVSVNEPLEEFLANSDQSKAQLDLSLLQEQMSDARTLAARGQLDIEAQTEVTENTNTHVQNLTATVTRLQAEGQYTQAATLAAQLYQTLQNEAAQVADMSSQGSNNLQLSLAPILVKLRTTLSTVALISTAAQAQAAGIKTKIVPTATIGSTVDSQL